MAKKTKNASLLTASATSEKDSDRKKPRKRARTRDDDDAAEERRLTALLFGGGASVFEEQQPEPNEESDDEEEESHEISENFFELDRTGDENVQVDHDENEQNAARESDDDDSDNKDDTDKPAWVDEDDERVSMSLMSADRLKKLRKTRSETAPIDGVELEQRLRQRFQDTTTARTDWADVQTFDKQQEDSLLESSAAPLLASSSDRLPPQVLQVVRCPDANQQDPNKAVVQAVHFHPGSDPDRPLMLTAGLDKTLRFFQVDAEESQKIHGIHCTSVASCVLLSLPLLSLPSLSRLM